MAGPRSRSLSSASGFGSPVFVKLCMSILATAPGFVDAKNARWHRSLFPRRLTSNSSYQTAEDIEASNLAVRRAVELCADVDLSDINRVEGRKELVAGVGDSNFILEALRRSNSTSEFNTNLADEMTPWWGIQTGATLFLSIMCIIVWWFVCYTAWPCCRCCRVCEREHSCKLPGKVAYVLSMFFLFVAMAACGFSAYGGKNKMVDGLDALGCTSARVLNFTVNGNEAENFIGMLPMLDAFGDLRGILNDGSPFVTSLGGIMNDTVAIEEATFIAVQTTELLRLTLDQLGNKHPIPSSDAPLRLYQNCTMAYYLAVDSCDEPRPECRSLLSRAAAGLSSGVAAALNSARAEVNTQMSAANRATLRSSFDSSIAPLTEAKDTVRDTTKSFLTDNFMDTKEFILLFGELMSNAISGCVFGVGFCAAFGALCCVFKENSDDRPEEERKKSPPDTNPWNSFIAPCAGCTWCWGFLYATLVFLLSGLMIISAVAFSSMCLIMDDLDSQMLRDISPGLGIDLNVSSPDFTMMSGMIDECFSPVTPSTNRSLMDIIFIEDNGTQVTLKEKIQGQTTDVINAQFANVDAMLNSGADVSLMGSPEVVQLLNFLNNPVDAAINPGTPSTTDTSYSGIFTDPRIPAGSTTPAYLGLAQQSSLAWDDLVLQIPGGVNMTLYGLNTVQNQLLAFTSSAPVPTNPVGTTVPVAPATTGHTIHKVVCNKNPATNAAINGDCTPSAINPTGFNINVGPNAQSDAQACTACRAGNRWMDLKAQVLNSNSFRCDVFQNPTTGASCDVLNMVQATVNGVTTWQSDCLIRTTVNGVTTLSMPIKTVSCDLPGFVAYMGNWRTRLSNVYSRVDSAQVATSNGIQVQLRNLVDSSVTTPVNNMVSQAQGTFLKREYRDMVDALCYKSVLGFRIVARFYSWNGGCTLALIVLSYGLWRHGIDNRNSYLDAKNKVVPDPNGVVPGDGAPKEAWKNGEA